ncbi:hypothetical protein [Actinokineospora bangkokensis]|uniref:Uncharacterized protein n=1 Tax=Actinokineospora bangkokensis TaxID=1193682 RepID=A0A1Q9LH49_9PSEU|nr:hypothetical protein [Actinokineospora bangkokensis]OLR91340.1 hypothetical protein BJP25_27130 [Actinokineospora bangkokensis]
MDFTSRWRAPALVVVAALALPWGLGLALGWGRWLIMLTLVLALALAGLVVKQILFHREQRELREEAARRRAAATKPPTPPHSEHHVPSIPVDSAEPYYRFTLSCTVCWVPQDPGAQQHGNLRGLAVHAILERARAVTVTGAPTDVEAVQARLAAELGAMLPDRSGQVVSWAEQVGLVVPDDDARRLARLVELRKEKQVRNQERELEQHARQYLADEVLTDPGTAVVWWLSRHPEQVREAAELLPTFAQLTAAVRREDVEPRYAAERLDGVAAPGAERPTLSAVANPGWPRITAHVDDERRPRRPEDAPAWPPGRDEGPTPGQDTSSAR